MSVLTSPLGRPRVRCSCTFFPLFFVCVLAIISLPPVHGSSPACFAPTTALRLGHRGACACSSVRLAGRVLSCSTRVAARDPGLRGVGMSGASASQSKGLEDGAPRDDVGDYLAGLQMPRVVPTSLEDTGEFYENFSYQTPLWILTQEPDLQKIILYLQHKKELILKDPNSVHHIQFSRSQLEAARTAFSKMVRRGEMRLHRLCELTGDEIMDKKYARLSVVIGQRLGQRPGASGSGGLGQRFQLNQPLSSEELYALTDLDLGSRQLERLMWNHSEKAALVANFVEYEALEANKWGVFKCISRIKAEEEIWNKVVDEIFEIDSLVKREKQLRHLSRFVKDVFGLKIVVGDQGQARKVQEHLESLAFAEDELISHGVPVLDETRRLKFMEVKDYMTENDSSQKKSSGWRALKSVVMWWDTPIEIQIQVLINFHRERDRITKESHAEFKAKREQLRDLIASGMPLFGFYRDLLQWLFQTTASDFNSQPPSFKNVLVDLID